ncbi:MerR family transcriptional regulator [Planobispora rosea]|uniref:MerR family transcriptional regulator n=1 Tax=Planobispora rosea TaxID=35762 RepID=UPI0027DC2FEC|nr:MerR family transcriptional regulator [Planobispora rosea]
MDVIVKPYIGGTMRIGELERRSGVNRRLLRYYEEQGLLRPERKPNGYREYAEPDVAAVRHIRNLLAAGLSTATIADLLPCMGKDGDDLIADCPELLLDLHREHARIQAAIHELETARTTLEAVIATAPPEAERAARAMLAPAS